ncbi:MAG: TolC family protein [Bacteroidales bacterium]|nr:TolC family protein [Bacteroidales bacterium]
MKKMKFLSVVVLLMLTTASLQSQDSIRMDLNKALEVALSESPTMRIADRDITIKQYAKQEQIVGLFPDASLSGSFSRTIQKQTMAMDFQGNSMEIEVGKFNNYSGALNISLPIVAPALWNSIKLSQLDVELALESARSSKISLIAEVKKAYYGMMLAQDSYDVLLLNYKNTEMNYQLVKDQYEQQMASEFDLLRADVQLKNQRPNIVSAKSGLDLATMMLKVLIGVDVNEPIIFEGTLADFESEMLSNNQVPVSDSLSLEENTTLMQLNIASQQLERARKILVSSSCPTLALGGAYQYFTMSDDFKFKEYQWYPYSYVGLSLNIPLVSWASTNYQLKSNKLSQENLNDQKLDLERNLRVSVNNSINNINNALEQLLSNKESVMQAERAYSISQKQYEVGLCTWLDLSNTELALTRARLAYTQSIYDYLSGYADLEAVLGNNN